MVSPRVWRKGERLTLPRQLGAYLTSPEKHEALKLKAELGQEAKPKPKPTFLGGPKVHEQHALDVTVLQYSTKPNILCKRFAEDNGPVFLVLFKMSGKPNVLSDWKENWIKFLLLTHLPSMERPWKK